MDSKKDVRSSIKLFIIIIIIILALGLFLIFFPYILFVLATIFDSEETLYKGSFTSSNGEIVKAEISVAEHFLCKGSMTLEDEKGIYTIYAIKNNDESSLPCDYYSEKINDDEFFVWTTYNDNTEYIVYSNEEIREGAIILDHTKADLKKARIYDDDKVIARRVIETGFLSRVPDSSDNKGWEELLSYIDKYKISDNSPSTLKGADQHERK